MVRQRGVTQVHYCGNGSDHLFMACLRKKTGVIAMTRNALKLFLLGMLLWPILVNVVGFLSPLWAILVLQDGSRSDELLVLVQPYVPLASVLFSASLVMLSLVDGRVWMKAICVVISVTYAGCSIYGLLEPGGFYFSLLSGLSASLSIFMLFLGGLILLRVLGKPEDIEDPSIVP